MKRTSYGQLTYHLSDKSPTNGRSCIKHTGEHYPSAQRDMHSNPYKYGTRFILFFRPTLSSENAH
ncbi:hypothetical protein VST7929_01894 [Vibrio stylophorae]|uniref:Uncharacterized protein n=1 Tax=Vibrio stylophorae TaxID=659351 RepID=A0ABM8ZVI2_9VIBR|nr:hypothetical protein VST7929_01894 [Vibrio stylophorae]